MVAAWPGMGAVGINACIYLLSKLDMTLLEEFDADDLFDVDHVEVREGILRLGRRPRHRIFFWKDPNGQHDLIVFLGEAQPNDGLARFSRRLIDRVRELGVEKLFTFAAMATNMHPQAESRVFVAATNERDLADLGHLNLETLDDGNIGGLNGVLLGVAAENSLGGACFLGEMPAPFSQVPFPKASLAVLEVFTGLTGLRLDFAELQEQSRAVEEQFRQVLDRLEQSRPEAGRGEFIPEGPEEDRLNIVHRDQIEDLFTEAERDRSKAFELKRQLDRFGVFKDYEDRFLDLFRSKGD
jgi:proteasome assembly chaperone (PAC2) family protein